MRFSHPTSIVFAGLVWLFIGMGLFYKGLKFIEGTLELETIASRFAPSREQGALLVVGIGLFIGFIKGRYVLSKTVKRIVDRVASLSEPLSLREIFERRDLLIMGGMILLGISIRFSSLSLELRGLIDVAIGSALINGALLFFREALAHRKIS